jgi:hypothetical protein
MSYYEKYLKYKNKYLELSQNLQQKGGAEINDQVYDNSNKYLGIIINKKESYYLCEAYSGKKFILKSSGENKLWHVKKQNENEIDYFALHDLSTSKGEDKIYELINVNDPSDVLQIRGDAPLKPIEDNPYTLYHTFHQFYSFINSLPNESSSEKHNLFFNEVYYFLFKFNNKIYLGSGKLMYTVKLISTIPKLDEEVLFTNFGISPASKRTPSLIEMRANKLAQIKTEHQIKRITIINNFNTKPKIFYENKN